MFQQKRQNQKIQKQLDALKKSCMQPNELIPRIKNMFKDTLSSNQIDLILKEKQRVKWTTEEMSRAVTLRYFGKRGYEYMRNDMNFPVPCPTTLQNFTKTINLKEGILEDVITFMGNFAKGLESKDTECIFSFDEVKIEYIIEYDPVSDEVIGPHNFEHPVTKKKCVYMYNLYKKCKIPDTPHLLKLLRNWLVDYGFQYKDKIISVAALKTIVQERFKVEMTPLFKFTQGHFILSRQNVIRAAELLSRTTANCVRRYCAEKKN